MTLSAALATAAALALMVRRQGVCVSSIAAQWPILGIGESIEQARTYQ